MLQVDASARQYDGRALRYTYTDGGIGVVECDGETDFSLGWAGDLRRNREAAINVSAYGFEVVEVDGYEYWNSLWFDNQSAQVQVRN